MTIRNTVRSNSFDISSAMQKYGISNPKNESVKNLLSSLQNSGISGKNDYFSSSLSGLDLTAGSLDAKLLASKQKMTVPALVEKFKRGESFTEAELAYVKKAKGGIEEMTKAMNEMKGKTESSFITDLLDKYKISTLDRKKLVIEISAESAKNGSYAVKVSGLSNAEASKEIEAELNSKAKIAHGQNLFSFFVSGSKAMSSMPKEFLAYRGEDKAKVTEYLSKNGFTGKISSLDVKNGKITGLPESLDKILNDPKLTAPAAGKTSEAFAMKQSLLKVLAQDKLNGGREVPQLSAKLTIRGNSLSIIEPTDVLESARKIKFPKTGESYDKLLQKNPIAWYDSVTSGRVLPASAPAASSGINLVG